MTGVISSIILKAIISIATIFIINKLIPWMKEKRIYEYVIIAVQAAEQMIKESGKGKEKYDLVCAWIKAKFDIDELELKNLIESAVYEMNNSKNL